MNGEKIEVIKTERKKRQCILRDLEGFTVIPEYPFYAINPEGDIYSRRTNKLIKTGNAKKKSKGGYENMRSKTVSLHNEFGNNSSKVVPVARLLFMTFKPELYDPKKRIYHQDGNTENNSLDNLIAI